MTNILTIEQASHLTGLSVTSIRRRIAAGKLPAMRAGIGKGKLLFYEDQLVKALRQEALDNLRDNDSEEPAKYVTTKVNEGFDEGEEKTPTLKDGESFFDKMHELGLREQKKKAGR